MSPTTDRTRPTRPVRGAAAAVLLAVLAALAAIGCGAPDAEVAAPTEPVVESTTTTEAPAPAAEPARVARPTVEVTAVTTPGGDEVAAVLPPTTELGSARALLVVGDADGWLEVLLPVRPNGATGWIPAEGVEVREVTLALEVDLAQRTLTLTDGDEVVLSTPAAIGADATPTPAGTFAITDKLVTPEPGGAYGPYALGLTGHSDVLEQFGGGDGQIGIHGTNEPSSIGQAVSHGCVRVPNDVITTLSDLLPLGTPVTVR